MAKPCIYLFTGLLNWTSNSWLLILEIIIYKLWRSKGLFLIFWLATLVTSSWIFNIGHRILHWWSRKSLYTNFYGRWGYFWFLHRPYWIHHLEFFKLDFEFVIGDPDNFYIQTFTVEKVIFNFLVGHIGSVIVNFLNWTSNSWLAIPKIFIYKLLRSMALFLISWSAILDPSSWIFKIGLRIRDWRSRKSLYTNFCAWWGYF